MADTRHVRWALEWLEDYLIDPLPIGNDLRESAIRLAYDERFDQALRCGEQLYHIGLNSSHAYTQGITDLLFGSIYFARSQQIGDWEKAGEHYRRSTQFFHNGYASNENCYEGIAWLYIGRLNETYSLTFFKNRWDDAIDAYQHALKIFDSRRNHQLAGLAQENIHRATQRLADNLVIQKYAQQIRNIPRPEKPLPPIEIPNITPKIVNHKKFKRDTAGVLILLFTIFGLLSLILIGAAFREPQYSGAFFIGYFVIVAPTLLTVTMLSMYTVPQNHAAIIERRGRAWEIEPSGWHWRIPLVDNVKGHIRLAARPVRFVLRDHITPDGHIVTAIIQGEYTVHNLDQVWMIVAPSILAAHIADTFKVDVLETANQTIDNTAKETAKQLFIEMANDPAKRQVLTQPATLQTFFSNELARRMQNQGLMFDKVQVEPYVR
jgi:tetratricopeptide (TPR) repeat protein